LAVANTVPPVATSYHFTEAPLTPGVAVNVIVPLPHRLTSDAVGAAGKGFTVAVTAVRAALSHVPERVEA